MRLVSDESRREITLTFTEEELGELVAAFGGSSHLDRSNSARFNEIPCIDESNVSHQFFLDLRAVLEKEAV